MNHTHDLNCQKILQNLNEYIDDELDSQLCTDIEAHIDSCPDCRIVVNTLKKTIHLYEINGQETELPEDVRARLFARLDLESYVREE